MEHSVKTLAKSFSKLKLVTDLFSVNTGGLYVCLESCVPGNQMYCDSQILISQWTKRTFYDVVCSKIDDSLLFPEGEVESKAYQGKENPRCSQNGKDDSDGESYWHHHWIRNTIVWD